MKKLAGNPNQHLAEILKHASKSRPSTYRLMLIEYMNSSDNYNPKKLRKFLDLIVEEIDKRKTMRGI